MTIKRRSTVPVIDYSAEPANPFSGIVPSPKKPMPEPNIFKGDEDATYIRMMGSVITETDPDALNVSDIVTALRTPYNPDEHGEIRYRARVKNRGTAVTAYCYDCQGGSRKAVTECASVKCPLWGFRFGSDPFRGRR